MKSLEELKEYFEGDRYAIENGAEILSVSEEGAKCTMALSPHHRNARGAVMGGAIFTLADFAFAVAANAEEIPTVTLTSEIHYLATAKGDRLYATAHCIRSGKSACHYRVTVTDEEEREVAELLVSGFKLQQS